MTKDCSLTALTQDHDAYLFIDDGIIVSANEFACKIFGLVELSSGRYVVSNSSISQTSEIFKFISSSSSFDGEFPIKEVHTIDANEFTLIWSILDSDFFCGAGILLSGRNITAVKSTLELHKKDLNLYDNILANLPANVYWKDVNGFYMGCNENLAKSSGLKSRYDVKGMTDYDFDWGDGYADKFREFDKNVIETKQPGSTEDEFFDKEGKRITVLTNKTPLIDIDGDVIGVLAVSVDISEKKELEEMLRKASQVKSEFIANMSHDLRTPMTGVMGMLDEIALLAKDVSHALPHATNQVKIMVDSIRDHVGIAQNSNQVLLSMFNDILEAVKLDSGKLEYKEEHFSLPSLLDQQVSLMYPVAKDKGLSLKVVIDPMVPQFFFGFKGPLYRSINNLLGNALKFTEEGGVTIGVAATFSGDPKVGDKVSLKIVVRDTGLGISEDKFDEIWGHFSKLESSYKKNSYQGSGLGLYTVKKYVEYMGGTISVDSRLGEGSSFSIVLSLAVSDHSDADEYETATRMKPTQAIEPEKKDSMLLNDDSSSEGKGCVLVVEDNAAAAASVMNKVRRKGYTAVRAESGEDAVSMVSDNDYSIVFMDIGLPGISGLEATELIRQIDHETRSKVPIVALTGHEDQVQACTDAGMQGLMLKPAQSDKIEKMLEKQLASAKDNLDLPVIDWDECVTMCCGEEEAKEIISMCAQVVLESKEIIGKHYQDNNVSLLRAELHKARGGVCYLKLPELEYRLRDFHVSIKENHDREELDKKYESLVLAEDRFLQYCYDKQLL